MHDCITAMDRRVGELLAELDAASLAESTIVFFYPDHGQGIPRGKRTLHDSGLHVPLLIPFPTAFQSMALSGPGTRCDRLVSFVDFGATVQSLCGVRQQRARARGRSSARSRRRRASTSTARATEWTRRST